MPSTPFARLPSCRPSVQPLQLYVAPGSDTVPQPPASPTELSDIWLGVAPVQAYSQLPLITPLSVYNSPVVRVAWLEDCQTQLILALLSHTEASVVAEVLVRYLIPGVVGAALLPASRAFHRLPVLYLVKYHDPLSLARVLHNLSAPSNPLMLLDPAPFKFPLCFVLVTNMYLTKLSLIL